jgi:hypothetical protein
VKLIDLTDVVLIGPGSEWFWTMVSGVVLAVTFIAIYRQLRVGAGAAAVEQMRDVQRDWQTEPMLRHRMAVLSALREGAGAARVPIGSAAEVSDYFERMGYLVRSGVWSRRLLHEYNGPAVVQWWRLLKGTIGSWRTESATPALFEHFEWLAGVMSRLDPPRSPAEDDDIGDMLEGLLAVTSESLRIAEQSRADVTPVNLSPRRRPKS